MRHLPRIIRSRRRFACIVATGSTIAARPSLRPAIVAAARSIPSTELTHIATAKVGSALPAVAAAVRHFVASILQPLGNELIRLLEQF